MRYSISINHVCRIYKHTQTRARAPPPLNKFIACFVENNMMINNCALASAQRGKPFSFKTPPSPPPPSLDTGVWREKITLFRGSVYLYIHIYMFLKFIGLTFPLIRLAKPKKLSLITNEAAVSNLKFDLQIDSRANHGSIKRIIEVI